MDALKEIAKKFDGVKIRMELIPPEFLWLIAAVLTFGATTYDAWNWHKGMDWDRVYGAALRHLTQFWAGEDYDESGFPHLANATCEIMFLTMYWLHGIGEDTRKNGRPEKDGTPDMKFARSVYAQLMKTIKEHKDQVEKMKPSGSSDGCPFDLAEPPTDEEILSLEEREGSLDIYAPVKTYGNEEEGF